MKFEFEKKDIEAIAQRVAELLREMLVQQSRAEAEDIIFDVAGVAEYLGVNKTWVYAKKHDPIFPYIKVGKYTRFKKSEIDEWLRRSGNKAVGPIINSTSRTKGDC